MNFRDAVLGGAAVKPKPASSVPRAVEAAPGGTGSSSSRGPKNSPSRHEDSSWTRVPKRHTPTSNWNGYAFVESDTGLVLLNSKHIRNEKDRRFRWSSLVLNFSSSGSPVPLASIRLYKEVRRPQPEADPKSKRPPRPALPVTVPINPTSLQFAIDSALQVSRGQKPSANLIEISTDTGAPFLPDHAFECTGVPVRVKINFESEEVRK